SRNQDEKGTITVLTMNLNQQDYRWKAYVGNVTGKLALDDGTANTIYDWSLTTITGEVYVSRASNINWINVSCANQTVIDNEQTALGMSFSSSDNINNTFIYNIHKSIIVGTKNIANSTCRSTATYINDAPQIISESALFQEILLSDVLTGSLIYTTFIEDNQVGYNGETFDFQLLLAENESSSTPLNYYFYVELG
ncbi:MAG: hypothetical protein QXK76_04325, partial [Candidatus Woesearchaeota archaeon]